jgi:hypothetical protein
VVAYLREELEELSGNRESPTNFAKASHGFDISSGSSVGQERLGTVTDKEIAELEAAATQEEWNVLVHKIRQARGGRYPMDWIERVLTSGVAERAACRLRAHEDT